MYIMTTEQELEVQRLQAIVSEKKFDYSLVQQELKDFKGSDNPELISKYKKAGIELFNATKAFNAFTESLPLKKSS